MHDYSNDILGHINHGRTGIKVESDKIPDVLNKYTDIFEHISANIFVQTTK